MAGERRREAAGSRPVLEMEVGCGLFYANVKIDNSLLATGTIAGVGVALSVFFYRNPALVEIAVKSAFAGLVDRVQSITLSSVLVYLCFHTKERLLAFMDAFATGTVKQRLEEEFSIIGFKDELEVTVTVYDNASRIRKEMRDGTAFESFESFVGSMESDTEERPTQISKGLERGKRRLLRAARSKEMTATSPKSRRVTKKEAVFGRAGEPSGIGSGSEEMTVGVTESGGALERGKRRLLRAAPSKEMTATSPKSRRVTKKEAVFGKAGESSGIGSGFGEMKGGGIKIVPCEGPLEGGTPFLLEFETLPPRAVTSVFATFAVRCQLNRREPAFFAGESIPGAATPGTVPVVVTTQEGNLLGETTFRYIDSNEEGLAESIAVK